MHELDEGHQFLFGRHPPVMEFGKAFLVSDTIERVKGAGPGEFLLGKVRVQGPNQSGFIVLQGQFGLSSRGFLGFWSLTSCDRTAFPSNARMPAMITAISMSGRKEPGPWSLSLERQVWVPRNGKKIIMSDIYTIFTYFRSNE
jgi:hypothetical protein